MRALTQAQLDQWNDFHAVGSPCSLKLDDGSEILTRTRSEAWVTGSGHALVSVEGKSGGWSLDRVRMLETHAATPIPLDAKNLKAAASDLLDDYIPPRCPRDFGDDD